MNSRGHCFRIVIDKEDLANKKIIETTDIQKYLDKNNSAVRFYAFIDHNKENKTPHLHLVIYTFNEYSERRILKDLASFLQCNINIISVEVSRFLVHDVRYLTHKDDYTKWQYTDDEVFTSKLEDYKDIVYKQIDIFTLSFDSLYQICKINQCNKIGIYSEIGLQNAKNYRYLIDDICEFIKKAKKQEITDKLFEMARKEFNKDD